MNWNFLIEVSPLISALLMAIITVLVYRLTKVDTRREHYLRYIVDLYYRIEDDYELLSEYGEEDVCKNRPKQTQCCRRISVNCILMRDYVKRYPGYYDGRKQLMNTLYLISTNPMGVNNYDKMTEEFKMFCLCIRKNKRDAGTIILDNSKEVDD